MKYSLLGFAAAMVLASCSTTSKVSSLKAESSQVKGPYGYISNLKDGDMVTSPFRIKFGPRGYPDISEETGKHGIRKASPDHYHILVDAGKSADVKLLDLPNPIPSLFGHKPYTMMLDLPSGTHTLQLALGDFNHESLSDMRTSMPIVIKVQ